MRLDGLALPAESAGRHRPLARQALASYPLPAFQGLRFGLCQSCHPPPAVYQVPDVLAPVCGQSLDVADVLPVILKLTHNYGGSLSRLHGPDAFVV